MTIESFTYTEVETIDKQILPSSLGSYIQLYDPTLSNTEISYRDFGYKVVVSREIESLLALYTISSIAEAQLPTFDDFASEENKIIKYREFEWGVARKHLELCHATAFNNYRLRGTVSCMRRGDVPYITIDLIKYFSRNPIIRLAESDKLAVRMVDVGFGLLSGNDYINISGSINKKVTIFMPLTNPSPPSLLSSTGTASLVSSSITSVTLLAANNSRKGVTIYNDSTANLYVTFGATSSTTTYTVLMPSGSYYETPYQYTGVISGIWSAANGNAKITELT